MTEHKTGKEAESQEPEAISNIKEPGFENKVGPQKKAKKKADDFAEELDVDPGIDYMRWSE